MEDLILLVVGMLTTGPNLAASELRRLDDLLGVGTRNDSLGNEHSNDNDEDDSELHLEQTGLLSHVGVSRSARGVLVRLHPHEQSDSRESKTLDSV